MLLPISRLPISRLPMSFKHEFMESTCFWLSERISENLVYPPIIPTHPISNLVNVAWSSSVERAAGRGAPREYRDKVLTFSEIANLKDAYIDKPNKVVGLLPRPDELINLLKKFNLPSLGSSPIKIGQGVILTIFGCCWSLKRKLWNSLYLLCC